MSIPKGRLVIFSAPSGAGKTTLAKMFRSRYPQIKNSISYTTRNKRGNEVDGVDYFFVDSIKFQKMIDNGDFLEYATIHDHMYGTSKRFINDMLHLGNDVLLVIDPQGVLQIKQSFQDDTIKIFITVSDSNELKKRLIDRGEESVQDIEKRIDNGKKELSFISEYDYLVVNDNLDDALDKIDTIYQAEILRVRYSKNMID